VRHDEVIAAGRQRRDFERGFYGGDDGRKELDAQGIRTIGMAPLRDLMRGG